MASENKNSDAKAEQAKALAKNNYAAYMAAVKQYFYNSKPGAPSPGSLKAAVSGYLGLLPDIHAPAYSDEVELPPKRHTVKELLKLSSMYSFRGFCGATCASCGATANLMVGFAFNCKCGTTKYPADIGPLHKHPTFGPTQSSIRLALKLEKGSIGKKRRQQQKALAEARRMNPDADAATLERLIGPAEPVKKPHSPYNPNYHQSMPEGTPVVLKLDVVAGSGKSYLIEKLLNELAATEKGASPDHQFLKEM